ncbi:MAG TPA: hypothetical protein VH253_16670, partial [Phycisphaerae bacterium]|nr:hypothetical protein [Phycisphaerae bacterium]
QGSMPGTTICGLADGTNWVMKTILQKFPEDFKRAIKSESVQGVEVTGGGCEARVSRSWRWACMDFEVVGPIEEVESVAVGRGIRELARLRKSLGRIGGGNERAGGLKLSDGTIVAAEVHWCEAHGKGKRLLKIKRFLEDAP